MWSHRAGLGVYLGSGEDLTSCHARDENPKQWWEGDGGGERQEGRALGVLVLL